MRIALIYAGTGDKRRDAASGLSMPPLGLPLLAALTPGEADVRIIDDSRQPIDFDARYDLVGISAVTPTAERAYDLSRAFRKRGARVVLGGVHPTTLPEEAAQEADSVVVGEADEIWPRLVEDFAGGRLQPRYEASRPAPLIDLPIPRWDLIPRGLYHPVRVIETTRGCPYRCAFCVVPRYFGRAFRHRPLEELEDELRTYFPRRHPLFDRVRRWLPAGSTVPYFVARRLLYIIDNNIISHRGHARVLFELLRDLDVRWIGHASITIADDSELLRLCAESGCLALNVGFESLDQEMLDAIGKPFNRAAEFARSIEAIHRHGIGIFGTFMVGLENDTAETFEHIVRFIEETRIDVAFPLVLAPLPGTGLYEEFRHEGRLIESTWRDYDCGSVVFRPRSMTTRQLFEGQRWAFERIFSLRSMRRRILAKPRVHPLFFWQVNREFRAKVPYIRTAWAPPPDLPPWEGLVRPLAAAK